MRLTEDVFFIAKKSTSCTKMFELEQASFSNYEMSITKCLTILGRNKGNIESIGVNNQVTVCDFPNVL